MLGPHFYYDLIRLARKPRNYYLRGAYLVALLISWWYVYVSNQPLGQSINDYARLTRSFAFALLGLQYALILILAPIYLAGSIVEERESGTLELLYQTHLTDREILFGKFAARVVHLVFFVLMSLPMLAIISLWGGIDVQFLLCHFALSFLLILLVGSMCLWVSVMASSYTEAMMLSYTLQFAAGYLGMPVFMIAFAVDNWPVTVMILSVPMLLLTGFFCYIALVRFRTLRNLEWMKRTEAPPRRLPRPKPKKTPQPRRQRESRSRVIPDHALLWRETEAASYIIDLPRFISWFAFAIVTILAGCFLAQRLLADSQTVGILLTTVAVLGFGTLMFLVFLSLTFHTTAAVAHERERHTLDFLLLLPVDRWKILLIKWLAPWIRQRTLLLATFSIPLIGICVTMFPARTGLLMLLFPWPPLLMVNTLGLLLSVVCRRTVTANIVLIAILAGLMVIHLLAWDTFGLLLQGYFDLIAVPIRRFAERREASHWLVAGHQAGLLAMACIFGGLAFWRFKKCSE